MLFLETCGGQTVDNVKEKSSVTNSVPLSFEENRDYLMSFVKHYHTKYMTNEDNTRGNATLSFKTSRKLE